MYFTETSIIKYIIHYTVTYSREQIDKFKAQIVFLLIWHILWTHSQKMQIVFQVSGAVISFQINPRWLKNDFIALVGWCLMMIFF